MCDFVRGRCEAVKSSAKFLEDWFKTHRNPCAVCGTDKSKCEFYKALREMGTISEDEYPP